MRGGDDAGRSCCVAGAGAYAAPLLGGCGWARPAGGADVLERLHGRRRPDDARDHRRFQKDTPKRRSDGLRALAGLLQEGPRGDRAGKGPDVGDHARRPDRDERRPRHAAPARRPRGRSSRCRSRTSRPRSGSRACTEGHRYGIPLDMHPLGLFRNKAVLDRGGPRPRAAARRPRRRTRPPSRSSRPRASRATGCRRSCSPAASCSSRCCGSSAGT